MEKQLNIGFSYDEGIQISLGERKYSTCLEALNESIRNSLDNKSSTIDVMVSDDEIIIDDNGIGLDEESFNKDYFRIGKLNPDPSKGGLFGIGVLGHRALSEKTEIISHVENSEKGISVIVDWNKKRISSAKWVPSIKEKHGTKIILTDLKYKPGSPSEVRRYLEKKYFPILVNPKIDLNISINGSKCRIKEPEYESKYEFDSTRDFVISSKRTPAKPEAEFGRVHGIIYIVPADRSNTTYVYDRLGAMLDIYSQKDWLKLNSLTSGIAFRSRLLVIINTTTEEIIKDRPEGNFLLIRSSREGFFEDTHSFRELVDYLNGKPRGLMNLPYGGILRLIHEKWLEEYRIGEGSKFKKVSDEEIKKITPVLNELLKNEETVWKTSEEGEVKEKVRKKRKREKKDGSLKAKNKRLHCPKCKAFNYISIIDYKVFVDNPNAEAKRKMLKNWPCKICGYYLNPDQDLHKIKSPSKIPGMIVSKVKIGKGTWVDIHHEGIGENGELGTCDISSEFLAINDQHAFYRQAYHLGSEMLDQHMIISALYAIAQAKKRELGLEFEKEFTRMCSNMHHHIQTKSRKKRRQVSKKEL